MPIKANAIEYSNYEEAQYKIQFWIYITGPLVQVVLCVQLQQNLSTLLIFVSNLFKTIFKGRKFIAQNSLSHSLFSCGVIQRPMTPERSLLYDYVFREDIRVDEGCSFMETTYKTWFSSSLYITNDTKVSSFRAFFKRVFSQTKILRAFILSNENQMNCRAWIIQILTRDRAHTWRQLNSNYNILLLFSSWCQDHS